MEGNSRENPDKSGKSFEDQLESSSDDDSSIEETDNAFGSVRNKRGILWCGVHTEEFFRKPQLSWPPSPSSVSDYSWRSSLREVNPNGPVFGNKMQLFSRTGYNIGIYYEKIEGTRDDNDLHTHLELKNVGHPGHVRIFGMLTNLYVAMDRRGRLYPEPNPSEEGTIFVEGIHGLYNTYLSLKYAYKGWYLGIKKSGKFKNGSKTGHKQKACLFLPRRGKFE